MFILNSQMFTARKICQIRNHFDFKYSIFFCLFLFSINTTRSTNVHTQFGETVRFFHPRRAQAEEGPGSCLITRYSLFGPLCCVSFFTFCLHSGRLCLVRDYKIAGSKQYKGNELKTKLAFLIETFSQKKFFLMEI